MLLWIDRLGRLIIALIFLYAAVPKLLNVTDFSAVIAAYGMLPEILLLPAAVLIPLFEIVLAFGLLFNWVWGKIGSLLLLLLFILILAYALYLGLDVDCGCFGPEAPEHYAFQGLRLAILRDVIMIVPLLYSLWFWSGQKKYPNIQEEGK